MLAYRDHFFTKKIIYNRLSSTYHGNKCSLETKSLGCSGCSSWDKSKSKGRRLAALISLRCFYLISNMYCDILLIKNNSPCKAGEPSLFRSKCSSKKNMVIDSEPFGHFFHSTTCTASSPAHTVSHVKLTYIPDNLPLDHHGFKNQLWSCRDFWNQQLKNNHKYPEAQAATTHRFWDDPKGRCDVFPKGKKQSSLVFESSDI